jgi:CSLREA domain-containing protein
VVATGLGVVVALAAAVITSAPVVAAGHTYVVRSTGDRGDRNVGDGVCDTTANPNTTNCTLRAAIEEANADAVGDRVRFAITAGSSRVKTITPDTGLPSITEPLTINGYSQESSSPNTAAAGTNARLRIVLDGSDTSSDPGLQASARVTIRGLVISNFARGIQLSQGADGSEVVGTFVGTDVSGKLDRGNSGSGILVNAHDVRLGSIARADRNLISGNDSSGISLGVAARDAVVQNNLIGTRRGGSIPLPNSGHGIFVTGSSGHLIGGTFPGQGNVIAHNRGNGVSLLTLGSLGLEPHRVQIRGNSLFANQGIGIDLGDDGRTRNDRIPDPDRGPNGFQNFPRLTSVVAGSSNTTIRGDLRSRRNVDYEIQFFQGSRGDPEARTLLGSRIVNTGSDGQASFTYRPGYALAPDTIVTAVATDLARLQTSEISNPRFVRTN